MTQFHEDNTLIVDKQLTAEDFISSYFSKWKYEHVPLDVLALFVIIFVFRIGKFLGLSYLRHEIR